MTYAQKLRSPLWQKKRLHILERDKWSCQACGSTSRNLQVHHLYYAKKDPWDYPDEAYQTLCEECHEIRQLEADPLIDEMRMLVGKIPTDRIYAVLSDVKFYMESQVSALGLKDPKSVEVLRVVPLEEGKRLFAKMREDAKNDGGGR